MTFTLKNYKIDKSKFFICDACLNKTNINLLVCNDPQLCSICVDFYDKQEYELTFGIEKLNDISFEKLQD